MNFTPHRYLLAICSQKGTNSLTENALVSIKSWKTKFENEVNETTSLNLKNGDIFGEFTIIGKYRFISTQDVEIKFKESNWLGRIPEVFVCPYTSEIVGYINFEFNEDQLPDMEDEEYLKVESLN